jgi:surface polysaccharide O-acyltransferase-like enzyme
MSARRSRAVDLTKLALAVMVVGIHANPLVWAGRPATLAGAEGLFRLGVPVFLVFNGYFLQGAIVAGRGWQVVRRVAGLYLLWMLLYLPIYWRLLPTLDGWEALRFALLGYWHLWYLSGLAMAAAVLVAARRMSDRALLALALLTWAGGVAVTYGQALDLLHLPPLFSDPLSANRNALFLCLPYAAFGVLIARRGLAGQVAPRRAGLVAVAGMAAVIGESFLLGALPVGVAHDTLASLAIAAPALALWALASAARVQGRLAGDLANGTYFLHVGFVALLFRLTDLPAYAVWALAVAGSILLTLALRRAGLARHLF